MSNYTVLKHIPNNFILKYTSEDIDKKTSELAVLITEWIDSEISGTKSEGVVVLPLLTGGVSFSVTL